MHAARGPLNCPSELGVPVSPSGVGPPPGRFALCCFFIPLCPRALWRKKATFEIVKKKKFENCWTLGSWVLFIQKPVVLRYESFRIPSVVSSRKAQLKPPETTRSLMTGGVGSGWAPGAICQGGPGPCALSCDFLGYALLPAVAVAAPPSRGAENLLVSSCGSSAAPAGFCRGVGARKPPSRPCSDLTGFLEGGPRAGSGAGWRW